MLLFEETSNNIHLDHPVYPGAKKNVGSSYYKDFSAYKFGSVFKWASKLSRFLFLINSACTPRLLRLSGNAEMHKWFATNFEKKREREERRWRLKFLRNSNFIWFAVIGTRGEPWPLGELFFLSHWDSFVAGEFDLKKYFFSSWHIEIWCIENS